MRTSFKKMTPLIMKSSKKTIVFSLISNLILHRACVWWIRVEKLRISKSLTRMKCKCFKKLAQEWKKWKINLFLKIWFMKMTLTHFLKAIALRTKKIRKTCYEKSLNVLITYKDFRFKWIQWMVSGWLVALRKNILMTNVPNVR